MYMFFNILCFAYFLQNRVVNQLRQELLKVHTCTYIYTVQLKCYYQIIWSVSSLRKWYHSSNHFDWSFDHLTLLFLFCFCQFSSIEIRSSSSSSGRSKGPLPSSPRSFFITCFLSEYLVFIKKCTPSWRWCIPPDLFIYLFIVTSI